MARSRLNLHEILTAILAAINPDYAFDHCYYRKPSKSLQYPCILYHLDAEFTPSHADNNKYVSYNRYTLTVMDKDPDSLLKEQVSHLPMCSLDNTYETEGINHFVFTIYY